MAPRRVIADSDDEDGGDNPLSPPKKEMEPPEVEPLSPGALDQHNQISDTTDLSFFASVYDEQHNRALEHSQLIENIVRQSQKASRSSGDVSLPAKGKGKKADVSSATNVTSPVVLDKPGNQPSLFSEGATNITTPRKSVPDEWDVPSSAEAAPRSAKSSRGKNDKSSGKRKRSQSKTIRSPSAAEIFMGYDATHDNTRPASNGAEPSPQAATKRMKALLHDPVLQDTPTTANFYIAQSNLTTMQKLEYQRVNVPQYGYSTLPGTLPNPKSSGMTTVAYSTPSRYTSSGPPLPWERSSAVEIEPFDSPNIINITSSPDVIAADHHDYAERTAEGTPHVHAHPVHHEAEEPNEGPTMRSPSQKKRKRRSKSIQDEDELVQGEPWNPEITDDPRDNHKRQRQDEQRSDLANLHEGDEDIELIPNPHEDVNPREVEPGEIPREGAHDVDELAPEMPSTEPPIPISVPEPDVPEAQPIPLPKKRGRKKKQPAAGKVIQEEPPVELQAAAQEQKIPAMKDPEVQTEPKKPKKKRGRPRKSDPANSETPVAPEPESTSITKAHCDRDGDELALVQTEWAEKTKPKPRKKQAQMQEENETADDPTRGDVKDTDASPLKELSSNVKTPSQKSMSVESVSVGSVAESSADQKLPSKHQDKGSITPKPTPTASQSKVPYRVGLSKRTRITSLLKSIRR